MDNAKLKTILTEHKRAFLRDTALINRSVLSDNSKLINSREVVVISGVRRSGKSSAMKLIGRQLIAGSVSADCIMFCNLDDERLINFELSDFDQLYNAYLELERPKGKVFIFLDEVQNVPMWEKWVNRMYEMEQVKIFVTGSNSSLLNSEYSTLLTGRNRQLQLYPFSFAEYLQFRGISPSEINIYDNSQIAAVRAELEEYCTIGGFPEVIRNQDRSLLDQYYKDIIFKDIIIRNKIRNSDEIRELGLLLSSGTATVQSLQKIKNTLGIKSLNSVKQYIRLFGDSFLFFQLNLFSYSMKQQIYNPRKSYCIDTGMARTVGFSVSDDSGRHYENLVFLELMRRGKEIYYWKSAKNFEVDLLIKEGTRLTSAIQVCINIDNPDTLERETRALTAARHELGIERLVLLTLHSEREINSEGIAISVIPIWKFLLNQ